jgi:integrase
VYKRLAETVTDAKKLRKKFLQNLENGGESIIEGEKPTFDRLAEVYRKRKIFAAKFVGGRKVAGLRSHESLSGKLNQLISYFNRKRVRGFTASDIETYKANRLSQPVEKEIKIENIMLDEKGKKRVSYEKKIIKTQRAVSSVNRELELLRSLFRFAFREGWILRSPFDAGGGATFISKADENKRDRVLSFDEEKRLLAALDKPRRKHLLPVVMTAIDTAMRRGELFKLQWKDVDLQNGLIFIQATNTKTQTERTVGMTPRVWNALRSLSDPALDGETLVFGITDTIKTGWKSACRDAGITGLHFHDLRHTAITRMVNEGVPSAEIMKTSGHTQMTTFQRYVNPTAGTARRNADRLARYHAEQMKELEIDAAADGEFIN